MVEIGGSDGGACALPKDESAVDGGGLLGACVLAKGDDTVESGGFDCAVCVLENGREGFVTAACVLEKTRLTSGDDSVPA